MEDVSHGQWSLEERKLRGLVPLLLSAESFPGPFQQVPPLGSKYDQNPGRGGQPMMNSQVWNSLWGMEQEKEKQKWYGDLLWFLTSLSRALERGSGWSGSHEGNTRGSF